jgi:hypothetical protein
MQFGYSRINPGKIYGSYARRRDRKGREEQTLELGFSI